MDKNKSMSKILIAVVILFAAAVFLYWNNKDIVITQYEYKGNDVPSEFDGFRITQVSDLQSEYFGKNQKNLISKVRETKPDLILITGDIADRNHTDYEAVMCAVSQLIKLAPVYYTNGNHDLALESKGIDRLYKDMEKTGVTVLNNAVAEMEKPSGQKIYLAGLDEKVIRNIPVEESGIISSAVKELTSGIGEADLLIMLAHEPQYFRAYAMDKTDLVFSGHAHGGQIRLPFTDGLYAPGQGVLPKLTSGMHKRGTTTMIISRGLGNSVFPFRVFNRPEITVTTLRCKNQ